MPLLLAEGVMPPWPQPLAEKRSASARVSMALQGTAWEPSPCPSPSASFILGTGWNFGYGQMPVGLEEAPSPGSTRAPPPVLGCGRPNTPAGNTWRSSVSGAEDKATSTRTPLPRAASSTNGPLRARHRVGAWADLAGTHDPCEDTWACTHSGESPPGSSCACGVPQQHAPTDQDERRSHLAKQGVSGKASPGRRPSADPRRTWSLEAEGCQARRQDLVPGQRR